MSLIDDLITSVDFPDAVVKDVRVGVTWTAVVSERCGLAKTYGVPVAHSTRVRDAGMLIGKSARELARYAESPVQIEASIGVAALNSMIEPRGEIAGNALSLFKEMGVGKRAVMVGLFHTSIDRLVATCEEFWIIEQNPALIDEANHILPPTAAVSVLPRADVVAITGSTLVNHSLEPLLGLCPQAFIIVLGPSTPMLPVLHQYGANVVAGTEVLNVEPVLAQISQGGGRIHPRTFGDNIRFRMMTEISAEATD
jgi:uncharacterized protein (DUF4213/DUF364 family)